LINFALICNIKPEAEKRSLPGDRFQSHGAAMPPATVVWINSFPGVEKPTVARAIATFDQAVFVLDDHQLIDPLEARFSCTLQAINMSDGYAVKPP
jgi:hypothetical protein